jgi:hypothetical protein
MAIGNTLTESRCAVLATNDGEKATVRDVPGMSVLGRARSDPLKIAALPGVTLKAVVCWRSRAELSENDDLVPLGGLSLYIKADAENEDDPSIRTIVLEYTNSGFRVRLLHGTDWTAAEEEEMIRLMSLYNSRLTKSPN